MHVPMDEHQIASPEPPVDILALDDALDRLAAFDARKSRVVELRFFGGLDVEETAAALDVSPQTVQRDWRLAKVWLFRELSGGDRGGAGKAHLFHELHFRCLDREPRRQQCPHPSSPGRIVVARSGLG